MRISGIDNRRVDEKLNDYLNFLGTAVKGLWDPKQLGKAELLAYSRSAKKNFMQYMGQNSSEWNDVTWNLLFRYLTMPNQFAFSSVAAMDIIKNPETRQRIMNEIKVANLAFIEAKDRQEWLKTWAIKNEPIGGPPEDPDSAKRAELIATHILMVAAVKHLSQTAGGSDMEDEQPTSKGGSAQDATPGRPSGQTGQTPKAVPIDSGTLLSPDQLSDVKAKLDSLKTGGARS